MGGPRPCVRNTGHNSFPTGVPFPHLPRACTGVGLLLTPQAGSVRSNLGQTSWARDTVPRPGRKENSQGWQAWHTDTGSLGQTLGTVWSPGTTASGSPNPTKLKHQLSGPWSARDLNVYKSVCLCVCVCVSVCVCMCVRTLGGAQSRCFQRQKEPTLPNYHQRRKASLCFTFLSWRTRPCPSLRSRALRESRLPREERGAPPDPPGSAPG